MRRVTLASAIVALLVGSSASLGQSSRGTNSSPPSAEAWDRVKLAVALESVKGEGPRFYRSVRWWLAQAKGDVASKTLAPVEIEGDLTAPREFPDGTAVHIHGDVSAPLRIGQNSEAVIGGSLAKGGSVASSGITVIYIHGDLNGTVSLTSMTYLAVRGNVRGEIQTGTPVLFLRVGGDLEGAVHPKEKAAMLYVSVRGHAAAAVLRAIDSHHYQFNAAIAASDLPPGIHPLWSGPLGFIAVEGADPVTSALR